MDEPYVRVRRDMARFEARQQERKPDQAMAGLARGVRVDQAAGDQGCVGLRNVKA